jgi:hypothetical protein
MNSLIEPNKKTLPFLAIFVLICQAFSPSVRAVLPPPDGGYAGGNTAEGTNALFSLTTGGFNTAVGFMSLRSNTDNSFNTAIGAGALLANTADNNTAIGAGALLSNTIGIFNTANGAFALFSNTEGHHNTAVGARGLFNNTTGEENTALGFGVLGNNTGGNQNAATGSLALSNNTTGSHNTANGDSALLANSTGNNNVALGFVAGSNVTTANNVICIGASVSGFNVDDSCFIGNIRGTPVGADAISVLIDSTGKLGTMTSSRRFKHDIRPMDKASQAILALKPVTFHYKSDAKNTPCFGLIAEEVAKVNPDLVVRNKDGDIYTVRYDQVNAMLLNEFLKARRQIDAQQKQIDALAAGLQKVSAQLAAASPSRGGLEASKFATGRIRRGGPASQVVSNP